MEELQQLLNMNKDSKSRLVIEYYNFLKSLPEVQNDEFIMLLVTTTMWNSVTLVVTTNWFFELENEGAIIVKHKIKIKDIEVVNFQEVGMFTSQKLLVKTTMASEPISFWNYGKDQLKTIEKGIYLVMGASLKSEDEQKRKESENSSSSSTDQEIKNKLKKLKALFEDELITKEDYEFKKKEILQQL